MIFFSKKYCLICIYKNKSFESFVCSDANWKGEGLCQSGII